MKCGVEPSESAVPSECSNSAESATQLQTSGSDRVSWEETPPSDKMDCAAVTKNDTKDTQLVSQVADAEPMGKDEVSPPLPTAGYPVTDDSSTLEHQRPVAPMYGFSVVSGDGIVRKESHDDIAEPPASLPDAMLTLKNGCAPSLAPCRSSNLGKEVPSREQPDEDEIPTDDSSGVQSVNIAAAVGADPSDPAAESPFALAYPAPITCSTTSVAVAAESPSVNYIKTGNSGWRSWRSWRRRRRWSSSSSSSSGSSSNRSHSVPGHARNPEPFLDVTDFLCFVSVI